MIKIETIGKPYMRYLYKCIPLAFDESMSYWEQVSSFRYYLLNEVMPALNNNAEAVAELQNYFANLDLQEEVDNKLEEMYENGQLEAIISEFLELQSTFTYDTVSDMKEANNLINGCYAKTIGYHNKKGGAYYIIRNITNEDTVDEMTLIALNDPSLVAELIIEKTMSPTQFGAYADGTHEDNVAIQKCFDTCNNILFEKGTYLISLSTPLYPKSNSIIDLGTSTIQANGSNLEHYEMFYVSSKDKITIKNGTMIGDRSAHDGATGEWGFCIRVTNSTNIIIEDITLKDAWGDGLYISYTTNIMTKNLHIDNCRRNGISVISVNGYKSYNDYIENINGTAPQCAIDLEPNNDEDYLKNIILENMTCKNCVANGIEMPLTNLGSSNEVDITIINPNITGCVRGINESNVAGLKGKIEINNANIHDIDGHGMNFNNLVDNTHINESLKVIINNPYIKNFNLNNNANGYGIGFGGSNANWGNMIINYPYVETTSDVAENCYSISLGGYNNGHPINAILNTPLNNQLPIRNSYGENVKIIDPNELYTLNEYDSDYLAQVETNINTVFTNKDMNEDIRLALRNYISKGLDTTFRCMNASIPFRIRIPSDNYCRSLDDTNPRIIIQLNHYGDSITLRRITDTEWIVVNMNCEPTISH